MSYHLSGTVHCQKKDTTPQPKYSPAVVHNPSLSYGCDEMVHHDRGSRFDLSAYLNQLPLPRYHTYIHHTTLFFYKNYFIITPRLKLSVNFFQKLRWTRNLSVKTFRMKAKTKKKHVFGVGFR